jgi:small-conductance mechanosensitive channel
MFSLINIIMRIHEFIAPLQTFIARVKLKNGSTVTATERTESLNYARQIFQHKYGDRNVFSESEVKDSVIDEATKTLSSQELQVKSLADQEAKIKQQKKQLQARQTMVKAQQQMRDANLSTS